MALITCLFLIAQIIIAIGIPIDDGTDVGIIKEHKGRKIVLNPGTFPFMVRLEFRRYHVENTDQDNVKTMQPEFSNCGGTLIRRDVVLTAGHCLGVHKKKPNIVAWLGILDTELEEGRGQEIPVRGYTIHNQFMRADPEKNQQTLNDIALLWLVKPANLDGKYVKLATLPTVDFNAAGNRGRIVGWGRQSCGPRKTMLQKAVVRALAPTECQKHFKYINIEPNVICILADGKTRTSTHGDSGGPFVVKNTVVGVASFIVVDANNPDVCDAKRPAVYSYVPKYLDWIQKSLQNGPEVILRKIGTSTTSSPKVSKRPTLKSKL